MISYRLLIAAFSFAVLGCTTGEKMARLSPGMSRDQVIKILGRPSGVQSKEPYEQLEYAHRWISGWSWDRSDFSVVLKEGKVVAYGHGEVRDRSPQMIYHTGLVGVNQNVSGNVNVDSNVRHSGTINLNGYGF